MNRYIFRRPNDSRELAAFAQVDLWERSRVLLQLFSDREALRLICAPALYGKSIAAYQYAQMAFSFTNVAWVDATDPRFVRDLDNGSLQLALQQQLPLELLVLDGVSELNEARSKRLDDLIIDVQSIKCEVIITTRDFQIVQEQANRALVIRASDLLLDEGECAAQRISLEHNRLPLYCRVPVVLCDKLHGRQRFVEALHSACISGPVEAIAIMALLLAKGSLSQLDRFFGCSTLDMSGDVEHFFPHAGIHRLRPFFESVALSSHERLGILDTYLTSLTSVSCFATETEFVAALAEVLLEQQDFGFLAVMLDVYVGRAEKERFCLEHGLASSFVMQEPGEIMASMVNVNSSESTHLGLKASQKLAVRKGRDILPAPEDRAVVLLNNDELGFSEEQRSAKHRDASASNQDLKTLDVRLLGRFEILHNGFRVHDMADVRKKAKVLVALLVINHDKDLSRQWVERIVWPESGVGCSRSSFYNLWRYVRGLLQASPDDLRLRRSRDTVTLRGIKLQSDVIAVNQLCDLLALRANDVRAADSILHNIEMLYRGPLLPGVENAQIQAYRTTLQNRVLDALLAGVETLYKHGETRMALHFASFAFHVDTAREDVCFLYMQLLKRSGQLTGAIATYLHCRRSLVDRFGIDGSRRLDALYEEILKEVS